MIKLLIGGSPCTHWSIAQSKNRETKAEGLGWELFRNFVIAKEKFQPDYFLYENNWSASKDIKEQIQEELHCELMRINSNLVSAQNRDRFYVFNWEVEQPEDRGILLKDILEVGEPWQNKSYALTTRCQGATVKDTLERHRHTMVAEPIFKYCNDKNLETLMRPFGSKGKILNCETEKSNTLLAAMGGGGGNGIYYAENINDSNNKLVYLVKDKLITINNKQYPINLKDGQYLIRKLTPIECERLQTVPDNYTACVSNTQRYKGLGNGWTAEVIIHILNGVLKDVPKEEKIIVLSMYDGIGTGRYCLDKMGFTNVEYHAYEIDKYAIQVAMYNYPDIIQHGNAFQVRNENWTI